MTVKSKLLKLISRRDRDLHVEQHTPKEELSLSIDMIV